MPAQISVHTAVSESDLAQIRALFREYFAWVENIMQYDLSHQDVENELISLPGAYAPPLGDLLLATCDHQPAGCVAFRSHGHGICEMKRMYVRPAFRGQGIARMLCAGIIQSARQSGYQRMLLDTEISLHTAQKIYTGFGFKPAQPYYEVPEGLRERTIFMELDLV